MAFGAERQPAVLWVGIVTVSVCVFGAGMRGCGRSEVEDEVEKVNRDREQHLHFTVEETEPQGGKRGCP